MSDIKLGDVFPTNQGGSVIVVGYKNLKNITVQHIDKYSHIAVVQAGSLKAGNVKNPYYKAVRGVGFVGVGDFNAYDNKVITPEYRAWGGMFSRCYSKGLEDPTYKDCVVTPEWHNFQVFAEWYVSHEFYGLGYHLDKDLLVRGNKVYSPSTCDMLPVEINSLLLDRRSERGEYPIGVSLLKRSGKFTAKLRIDGVTKNIGSYDTAKEAHKAYVVEKEANVKRMALSYKDKISKQAFSALMNWKVIT